MANLFQTPTIIAREALRLLKSNMVAARLFSRRYETEMQPGLKRGDTVKIRRRADAVVDEFSTTITVRDTQETTIDMVLEKHFDTSFQITSKEQTLDLVSFSQQVLAPKMLALAEKVDTYALSKIKDLPNAVGTTITTGVGDNVYTTPGAAGALVATTPGNALGDLASGIRSLDTLRVPMRGRVGIVSPEQAQLLRSAPQFVEVDKSGSDEALREANLGRVLGVNFFLDQNVDTATHTSGTGYDGTTNGAIAAGATSFVFDNMTTAAGTLKVGDIVKIAGYGNVVVAADVTASTGAGTITVKEPFTKAVGDGVAFTVYDNAGGDVANTRENHGALFHPEAFSLVVVPLDLPEGAPMKEFVRDEETGIAIRLVKSYNLSTKADQMSLDVLVGAAMVQGAMGGQITKSTS